MTLGAAAVLFLLAAAGIPVSRRVFCTSPRLRLACTLLCTLAALACAVYLGAGLLLLCSIQAQPPAP